MWIFMSDAFVSIVADRDNLGNLMVRARRRADLVRAFGKRAKIRRTPNGDYRFRTSLPAGTVANVIYDVICGIGYENFKDSVRATDRHDAYLQVWREMRKLQEPKRRKLSDDPTYNLFRS